MSDDKKNEKASNVDDGECAILNEEIVEKLKLLNYEQLFTRTK
jgi:hypothetical protein